MPKQQATNEVTADKFTAFLTWLSPDEGKAGEEYERLRFRLITFFAGRNCRFPEDLADETINRVVLKIGSEVVENKIVLHKYSETYFDKANHEKKIPAKTWGIKDFQSISFGDVTDDFLGKLRQTKPKK